MTYYMKQDGTFSTTPLTAMSPWGEIPMAGSGYDQPWATSPNQDKLSFDWGGFLGGLGSSTILLFIVLLLIWKK